MVPERNRDVEVMKEKASSVNAYKVGKKKKIAIFI